MRMKSKTIPAVVVEAGARRLVEAQGEVRWAAEQGVVRLAVGQGVVRWAVEAAAHHQP